MKIMAVDFGDSRTGLAACDRTEFLASPICIIKEKNFDRTAEKIALAAKEQGAEMLVIGLPKNMDGTEGVRAEKSRKLAEILEDSTGLPIVLWDERSTTKTADAWLSDSGTFGKKRKEVLDAVAATVILESYLAYRKNHKEE